MEANPQTAWRARRPSSIRLLGALVALVAFALGVIKAVHISAHSIAVAQAPAAVDRFAAHEAGTQAAATLNVDPSHPELRFSTRAVGLSVEADEIATQDLSPTHSTLVRLMRLLGPGVLRLGGDSLDYSWWTAFGESAPAWATSVVTPSDLIELDKLLVATNWSVILGLDLAHFDPGRAASEAHAAERILGSHLLGFEIGN